MTVCLDSWAILRWLEGKEPAAGLVEETLETRPVMSWLNLGEVFYVVHRAAGEERALEVVRDLRGRLSLDQVSPERVIEAASIKAVHSMAFADAFALATATAHEATLFTGDPEIIDSGGGWRLRDLR